MNWIAIETRVPETDAENLITGYMGNVPGNGRWTALARRDPSTGKFHDSETGEELYPPTHWMPIPGLPQ